MNVRDLDNVVNILATGELIPLYWQMYVAGTHTPEVELSLENLIVFKLDLTRELKRRERDKI